MPKKGEIRKWNAENMKKAIQAVRAEKMGILLASKTYGVPFATLQRAARSDKTIDEILAIPLGRRPVFNRGVELELVRYLREMEAKFWGLTRSDVRSLAFQLAKRNNIENPFSIIRECAGKDWLRSFLNRHKTEISLRSATGTSIERIKGFNVENVSKFYNLLEQEFEKHKFSATRIWNVDETGVSIVQSKQPKILAAKGKRQIGCMTSAERGSLITVISCMSAGGAFVPPFFIFPRKNPSPLLMKHAPPGSDSACHISGWIQIPIFTAWFDHFLGFTNPSKENPILLILDGHYSHTRNVDVLDKARQNGVIILSLPPHCTHKMQPLDKAFMGPLKTYYNDEIRRFMREQGRKVTQFDVVELFSKAYLKVQTAQIAINGFKCTGIYPFDKNIFQESDFMEQRQENPLKDTQPIEDIFLEEPVASTSRAAMKNFVTPWQISPPPKLKLSTSSRGKRSESTVLTTSPYKALLEESIRNVEKRKKKGNVKDIPHSRKTKTQRATKTRETSSSESEKSLHLPSSDEECWAETPPSKDTACAFCNKNFETDKGSIAWVPCLLCDLVWAHSKCLPKRQAIFVCESCQTF
ncbi:uncharacterized protein LOC126767492 [Bactrocera neohumeralis]|uniref:uncharacterized protein LOC126767492 n=2 Tax=Bactrocera neohumeralis TaxID=98809 RepID=UPI002166B00C|nr:uncharacterized protein LOC126767492 [Bactrocera neohumeralis]